MTQRRHRNSVLFYFPGLERDGRRESERARGGRTLWIVEFKRAVRNIRLRGFFLFSRRLFFVFFTFFSSVLRGQWDFTVEFTPCILI